MEIEKNRFQKEIIAPFSGQKFIIRRVRFKDFMTELGTLPVTASRTVQDVLDSLQDRAEKGDTETETKITRFYASRGVVSPKIWFGNETECPADQIYWEDLGGDLDLVVGQVINYSHEMVGLREFEAFFRGTGGGAVGPVSETLRAEAIESSPDGVVER